MTDDKPSLAEWIEALADGGLNGIVYPQLKEPLYRIAAELREIADSLIANGYSSNLYKIANRLAGKEGA